MKTEGVMKITTTYFPPQFEWVKTAGNKSISANIPLYNFCENLPKLVIYLLYRWFISNIAIVTYSNYSRYMKLIKLVLFSFSFYVFFVNQQTSPGHLLILPGYCHCSICRRLSGAPFSCQALFTAAEAPVVATEQPKFMEKICWFLLLNYL